MADKNDVVIAIAANLYARLASEDAIRDEPSLEKIANEAWDLYYRLQRAVIDTSGEASNRANTAG
jgi:hypothetical protein